RNESPPTKSFPHTQAGNAGEPGRRRRDAGGRWRARRGCRRGSIRRRRRAGSVGARQPPARPPVGFPRAFLITALDKENKLIISTISGRRGAQLLLPKSALSTIGNFKVFCKQQLAYHIDLFQEVTRDYHG
uniref:Uncharacterized protein n=1 Tax=Leersia perrieri TaxID=77586 RepID=A0A0D9V777_9ORYZ